MNDYHTLITKSPLISQILEIIERAAKSESSVLLLGESGVGKELFAEQVHLRSSRKDAPFIRVNCAAIPDGLLESELFGHVKGAFTDAVKDRQGRFNMADKGTIFLDEIAEMPLILQRKILRVIQEKKLEKVGADEPVNINVRVIAATNKDLDALVAKGAFREDLYYRLNVLPITIPPLRERKEDIIELADFFLAKHGRKLAPEAMQALLTYSWPGNVRELENCIERACIMGKKPVIGKEDLLLGLKTKDNGVNDRNLKKAVNSFKKSFVIQVLKECNWNKTEAARSLDIQRTYLSKLIKELNIENDNGTGEINAGWKERR